MPFGLFFKDVEVGRTFSSQFVHGEFLSGGDKAKEAVYEWFGKGREQEADKLWAEVQRRKRQHIESRRNPPRDQGTHPKSGGEALRPPTGGGSYNYAGNETVGKVKPKEKPEGMAEHRLGQTLEQEAIAKSL